MPENTTTPCPTLRQTLPSIHPSPPLAPSAVARALGLARAHRAFGLTRARNRAFGRCAHCGRASCALGRCAHTRPHLARARARTRSHPRNSAVARALGRARASPCARGRGARTRPCARIDSQLPSPCARGRCARSRSSSRQLVRTWPWRAHSASSPHSCARGRGARCGRARAHSAVARARGLARAPSAAARAHAASGARTAA